MSKHNKGINGNSQATSSAASSSVAESSTPWLSSAYDLVDVLDSFGIDLTAMLLIFWCLVAFIVVFGINLYLTISKRQQRIQNENKGRSQKERTDSEESITVKSTSSLHSAPKRHSTANVTGKDEDCVKWIQKVIDWLSQSAINCPAVINECIDAWLASLNSKSKKLTIENGVYVEFVRLYRDQSTAVRLVDVKVENEINDNVLTTLKAICDRLVIQVRVAGNSRDLSSGQSSMYEIVLEKFSALLKVVCKPEDSLFVARFLERPETKVHINGPLTPSEKSFSPDLIINGVLNILTSTLVDLNFCYATNFPKFHSRTLSSLDNTLEIPNGIQSRRPLERKLFVTIVKANNLAVNQSKEGHEVYCSIEINEPKEKRRTSSVRKDANSPVWQDHFLFGLNEKSKEILFEVFDGYQVRGSPSRTDAYNESEDECIGFGIANILELRLNPSEKLVIPLQTRSSQKGASGGSLEIELLLMEHKLASSSVSSEEVNDQANTQEKIATPKYIAELNSINYRDLSYRHSCRRASSQSSSSCFSSSGFNDHSLFDDEELDQHIASNPIPNYDGNESDEIFSTNRSSKASSFLASLENEYSEGFCSSLPTNIECQLAVATGESDRCEAQCGLSTESLMSVKGAYDSRSTSNSSITSSNGASPKGSKSKKFARLAKIASLSSLFSGHSSSSGVSVGGSGGPMTKSTSNSSISTYGNRSESKHPHPSRLYTTNTSQHHLRVSPQHPIPSLAMSLPVISPLIDVNRQSYPSNGYYGTPKQVEDQNVPGILVTQPSIKQDRTKFGSLRWLRGASFRRKSGKPIQLPPTVLYPSISTVSESMNGGTNGTVRGNSTPNQLSLKQCQSNLEIVNKRSSLYSQLSFDSIDSRLSMVDDSTLDEDYLSSNRLIESVTMSRPPPLPVPISLHQYDSLAAPLYGKYAEKAKSDTHLFFGLDETFHEDALREHAKRNSNTNDQFFFGDTDLMAEDLPDEEHSRTTPPATPLKRNSNRRTSLYARFISAKRNTTKVSNSNNTVNSVKQRFKFRSSSKVPKLAQQQTKPVPNGVPMPFYEGDHHGQLLSNSHRSSEPSINSLHQTPSNLKPTKMSVCSVSSVNLSSYSRDQQRPPPSAPLRLQPPPRRRSYKNADMSLMNGQSATLSPLTNNSANSTASHLDQYARSSLNTIKSDDNALSSEGYGTDRGTTPDVPAEMPLPPIRPESRASQPREPRSLIRTIRKRLSFSKRSKSVERQPNSFRERSVTSQEDERARSVPGSREPSAPRDIANGKKQESFLSLASNNSFFAENSTLVLECNINGEKKHFIVPYSKANKRKYRRRKGTKLHVFNDHLFVAQHVPSSSECQVCNKSFPLRIGKQGYQCRECGFLTHKQCHVIVETFCPANGAARLNFETDSSDTPKQMPSPVPEVRVIAPSDAVQVNEKEIF